MVFYLKYRPQKISELDSEPVRAKLSSLLSSKDIPHAFLFSGPKGLGKTSAARIVAKIVNCEKIPFGKFQDKQNVEPCNKCGQCVSIVNGTNFDVLEIDAASNRGIDEIRDLREKIKLAPAGRGKKVYIIDEVHMLTTEAFNALLKTLEEPPEHAMFVLCTTELHKVPETIVSRCFHVAFTKADAGELSRSLKRVITAENIHIDSDAIIAIAHASDGSFRDAAKLLELAVLRLSRKKITSKAINDLAGNSVKSVDFLEYLFKKDAKSALVWLNDSMDNGLNMKLWLVDLLVDLHSALLSYYNIEKKGYEEIKGFKEEDIKRLIELFSRAHGELRVAVIPQLPAEIAIIEYCLSAEATQSVAKEDQ